MVFDETHTTQSNTHGLVNLQVGIINTGDFGTIDWSSGPYFVRITVKNGMLMGTSQLLSVPYALYAENGGEPGPEGPLEVHRIHKAKRFLKAQWDHKALRVNKACRENLARRVKQGYKEPKENLARRVPWVHKENRGRKVLKDRKDLLEKEKASGALRMRIFSMEMDMWVSAPMTIPETYIWIRLPTVVEAAHPMAFTRGTASKTFIIWLRITAMSLCLPMIRKLLRSLFQKR